MKTCAITICLILSFCSSSREDIPHPQPASEKLIVSENKSDSRVSASAEVIKRANELNTNENSKTAIDAEANLILISTGAASPADIANAKARLDKYIQGRTKEAEELRLAAEKDARSRKNEIDALREQHAKEVSEAKAEIASLKAKAEEERKENVTLWFAFVGSALASIGVLAVAFTPFKQGGIIVAASGVLIGGAGLLWDNVWFKVSLALIALACVAFAAAWLYKSYKKNGQQ